MKQMLLRWCATFAPCTSWLRRSILADVELSRRIRGSARWAIGALCVAVLLLALPSPAARGAPPADGPVVHVVQWGENLTVIAARYGVSIDQIVQANRMGDPNHIYVGQRLVIPVESAPAAWPAGSTVQHVVQAGDTLSALAVRYGSTVNAIVQANRLVNPSFIYVGQVLVIPSAAAPVPATGTYYTVRPGDTLTGIAYRYGVSYWAIVQANNLYNPSLIYAGQVLVIPGGGEPPPAPPPAPSTLESWFGVIVSNPPGAQYDDYLETADGARFGIASNDADICQLLVELRDTEHIVHVWGVLYRDVPDVNGTQIVVSSVEVIWEPGQPTPTPGPCTGTSCTSPTPTPTATPGPSSASAACASCALPTATCVPLGPVPLPSPWPPKALHMDSPEYGMEVHLWLVQDAIIDRDLRLVKDAGFTWVKQLFRWRDIEVRKGEFDWSRADRVVAMVAKYELDLAIAVAYQPEWAGGNYPLNGPPNNMADFAEFMAALAKRYKGLVRAYEIWPGPNVSENWGGQSPDYERYAEMLIDGYWFAKEQDPYAMIISGGLVQTARHDGSSVPPLDFFKALSTKTKAPTACDVWGVEALGYLAAPEVAPAEAADPALNNSYPATREQNRTWCFRSIEDLHEYTLAPERAIKKQWVVTQMGWTTDPRERSFDHWAAVSDQVKADYLRRAYRWAKENWSGWIGVMFVPLTDAQWTTGDTDYWWGIVNPDGSPRPAYNTLKEMGR